MAPSFSSSYSSASSADSRHHHHHHHHASHQRSSGSKRRDSSRRPALPRASTVASITTSNASRKELATSPKATDLLNRVVLNNAGSLSPPRSPMFGRPSGHLPTSPFSRTEESFLEALEHMRHNSEQSDPSHYFSFPSIELSEDPDQQELDKGDST